MTDSTKASVRMETGEPRYAVAHVTGRLDAAGVVAVEPAITRAVASHERLALDLAEVPYLASMGLRLLMAAARTLEKRGGRLVVVNPTSEVEAVLAIAGLEKPLRVCSGGALAKAFG
ncbi:MAG: STAS domain-containing protein [Burkholderiales bacterium]|nr:STAS domain-containing protein [Opitutaceae bacterium]